jgi:hypothetical protein
MEDLGTVTTTSNGSFVKVKYTLLSVNDNELSKKKNVKLYEDVADRIVNMPLKNEQYSMQIEAMGYEISGLQDSLSKEKDRVKLRDTVILKCDEDMQMMHKSLKSFAVTVLITEIAVVVLSAISFYFLTK